MIGNVEQRKEYCSFLFGELTDIKKRIDDDADRDFSENVLFHLRDISRVIDAKLELLEKDCPEWSERGKNLQGRSERVRFEDVPYDKTPM